jgi:hypothetical protein
VYLLKSAVNTGLPKAGVVAGGGCSGAKSLLWRRRRKVFLNSSRLRQALSVGRYWFIPHFMQLLKLLILLCFCFCTGSCRQKNSTGTAIKDFRPALQQELTALVTGGVAGWYGFADSVITNEELNALAVSEHPLIRIEALEEMLRRPSFNGVELIREHLNDTALISVSHGEFGFVRRFVSDKLLEDMRWKNKAQRDEIGNLVLLQHSYLSSAYIIAPLLEPLPRYYDQIKDMLKRQRSYEDLEPALYALARYKKKQDISFIKEMLRKNHYWFTEISFQLMRDFPDTSYMKILGTYAFDLMYHQQEKYLPPHVEINTLRDEFFQTLAFYKSNESARTLSWVISEEPKWQLPNGEYIFRESVYRAIYQNACPAYDSLLKVVTPYINSLQNSDVSILVERYKSENRHIQWKKEDVYRWWYH